ncbi:MAG: hypothetical protein WDM91_22240 [Rhizomicrobium sp.]
MTGRQGERGLALIVVLWGIAALSLIAGAMLATSMTRAHVTRNAWAQLVVQSAADSAVQGAVLSLFDPDPKGLPPLDGNARSSTTGDTTTTLSVQDEAGRIDLNAAGSELLRNYFRISGIADADAVVDRVIAWRTPKSGGDEGAGRPFQSVAELALVPGMTPALVARLAPGLTVYSHRASFDMRYASRLVIAAIPGVTPQAADQMIAHRVASVAARGHAFTIVATVTRGPVRFSREAVVLLTGDPRRPYWMLDWR